MRTTVDITDELMRSVRKRAADESSTFRTIVEKALRQYLTGTQSQKPFRFRLTPHPRGRMLPGVILEDRDALYELMEGRG